MVQGHLGTTLAPTAGRITTASALQPSLIADVEHRLAVLIHPRTSAAGQSAERDTLTDQLRLHPVLSPWLLDYMPTMAVPQAAQSHVGELTGLAQRLIRASAPSLGKTAEAHLAPPTAMAANPKLAEAANSKRANSKRAMTANPKRAIAVNSKRAMAANSKAPSPLCVLQVDGPQPSLQSTPSLPLALSQPLAAPLSHVAVTQPAHTYPTFVRTLAEVELPADWTARAAESRRVVVVGAGIAGISAGTSARS